MEPAHFMFSSHRQGAGVGDYAGRRRICVLRRLARLLIILLLPAIHPGALGAEDAQPAIGIVCGSAITSCGCTVNKRGVYTVDADQAYFNATADLLDNNSNCGKNFWINNRFQTSAPGANACCLK